MPPTNPNSNPSTTLTHQKSTFLTRQIHLLSTPLTPSPSALPQTITLPLLSKLNKRITSHNRLSFPLESQRHVLEQVEGVYWRDVLSRGLPVGKCETVVGRDVDFLRGEEVGGLGGWGDVVCGGAEEGDGDRDGTEEEGERRARKRRRVRRDSDSQSHDEQEQEHEQERENEHSTPETSSSPSQPPIHSQPQSQSQRHRYQTLQTHLLTSQSHRTHLRQKLQALRRLKQKLEPFENAQEQVQPNLMWKRNREVEGEIARMRVLLVRCAGVGSRGGGGTSGAGDARVQGGMREGMEEREIQIQTQTQTQKIEAVLGLG